METQEHVTTGNGEQQEQSTDHASDTVGTVSDVDGAGTHDITTSSSNQETDPSASMTADDEDVYLMEQFLSNPAHDYRKLHYGETIDGTIMRIDKDGILVDIGGKSEGVVPAREMQALSSEERAALHIGNAILVFVIQAEGREGHALLSIDKARMERSWRTLQHAFEQSEQITATVVNYNKGGLLVEVQGIRGFVPASQIEGVSRTSESQKQSDMARLVGQSIALKVIELNRTRNRLILSERQAAQDAREEKKDELLAALHQSNIVTGTVSSICDFGIFIDVGGADGLVHLSELSWGRVHNPSELFHVGQTVSVFILSVDHERRRIALSIKRTQPEPWDMVTERYQLGQIVTGCITQTTPFGAFASIEEGIEGLIHISELGDGHAKHSHDVVKEGDVLSMRIIRIDPARKRMGLSLRLHQEGDGASSDTEPAPCDANV